jgi:hypothetical protein
MKPLRIPLRAVLYRERNAWIAHCLEFDLIGDGKTQKQALASLTKAIRTQLAASVKYASPANLFRPASGEYFRMFAAGKNVAVGELRFQNVGSLTIEEMQAREYSDDPDADLVVLRDG